MPNQIPVFGLPFASRSLTFQQNAGQINSLQGYGGVLEVGLAASETFLIPEGNHLVTVGPYTDLQTFDPVSQIWRGYNTMPVPKYINSDGTNYRLANLTGCPVGAIVTTAGTTLGATFPVSMYTSTGVWQAGVFTAQNPVGLIVTPNLGGSTWNTFIGGAINTTITITAGGSGYTLAPLLVIVPPASQGAQPFIPATATCTISGGAINAVTVTNQGAGYVAAPTVLILPQPGDTTGTGGVLTTALTGAGQVTAMLMATPGTARTAVVTLAFSGTNAPASAAATAIMNFTVLAGGTPAAGAGYTVGYGLYLESGKILNATATAVYTNPAIEKNLIVPEQPLIFAANTTVIAITADMIEFGGYGIQLVPRLVGIGAGMTTAGGISSTAVGGASDTSIIQPL